MRFFSFDAQLVRCLPWLLVCLCSAGCPSTEDTTLTTANAVNEIADKDRPPLRILLIDQPSEVASILERRWAAVTEQRLQTEAIGMEDFFMGEPPKFDVAIAPYELIGTLVDNQMVTSLTDELKGSSIQNAEQDFVTVTDVPVAWRAIANYGKDSYGVPLGLGATLVKLSGENASPMIQSAPIQANATQRVNTAMIDWSLVRLANDLRSNSPDRPDLVDLFLTIVASQREKQYESSLLFDLVDGSARLTENSLLNSARTFYEVVHRNTADVSVTVGWPSLSQEDEAKQSNKEQWAIPKYTSSSKSEQGATDLELPLPLLDLATVGNGRAPMAFIGSRTRQSSKSLIFVKWLSEPGQRRALADVSLWIPTNVNQSTKVALESSTASSVEDYRGLMSLLNARNDLNHTFRFNQGWKYREALRKTLEQIANEENVDQVPELMRVCNRKWNELTAQIGKDLQQDSLERMLGLRD